MKLLSKLFATILHCILLGPEAAVAGEQVSSTLEHMDDNSYVRDAQPTGRYRIYRQQSIKVKPTMTYSCKSTWHIQLGQIFTQPICYSHSGILHKLHILQSFLTDAAVPTLTIKSTG